MITPVTYVCTLAPLPLAILSWLLVALLSILTIAFIVFFIVMGIEFLLECRDNWKLK